MSGKWFILRMFVLCGRCYVAVSIPSVTGLQNMLDVCVATADMLSLKFNPLKSHCLAIGKLASVSLRSKCGLIPTLYLGLLQLNISEFTLSVVGSCCLTLPQLNSHFLLPVTLFMLRLRVLMRRCIYPSIRAIVFLF